ncbi:MAG: CRTAC1 family protein [Acidobacteria bacterium]|nr:CRTAC1 family protein [Acidobacteriota bacterium]
MKQLILISAVTMVLTGCGGSVSKTGPAADSLTGLRFADATARSGIDFKQVPTRTDNKWIPEIMGSGAAVADFNRDGAPDVIIVNGGAVGAVSRPENARTRLYINDGKGAFADKTDDWKLSSVGYGQGAAVGDIDNDGFPDLLLTELGGDNRLFRNTGSAFEDVTEKSGLKSDGKWATSAGFADFDNDGNLDLWIVRYVEFDPKTATKVFRNRLMIYPTPTLYASIADQLWRNTGGGKFVDVSEASGIKAEPSKGLALGITDIDGDGDEDVYVANDTDNNQLWINDGKGKFKDVAQIAGVAYSETGREEGSMGVDFNDFDGNGRIDIAVTNFQDETTAIYSQTEPLLFREISDSIGIGQPARARLKFGIDFFDGDNDGDEDLLVANGHVEDNISQNSDSVTFEQQNTLYENLGNGRFRDVSDLAGDALADKKVSRGLVTADFDGDGDLDFLVVNNGGSAQIAFNETASKGNFVGLWLEGAKANRSAIGARVVAKFGARTIERRVQGAQSYLSVSDFRVHLGLGEAQKIDELTIFWPGGGQQSIKDVAAGKFYHVKQDAAPAAFVPGEKQLN